MRWLLLLLLVLFAAWALMPRPEPVPAEESVIAEPVKQLKKAEAFEDTYLEETKAAQERMEKALGDDDGH